MLEKGERKVAITITEALAEIKTIGKRLDKKRQAVLSNIGRDSRLKDQLEGGALEFVKRERQGIEDLEKRIVSIRTAIQKSNLVTTATVGDNTMTVQEWLNFRREVAAQRQMFLSSINTAVKNVRDKVQRDGGKVLGAAVATAVASTGERAPIEIILHVDERALLEEQEGLEKTLGDLDGKLSLLNATTIVDL